MVVGPDDVHHPLRHHGPGHRLRLGTVIPIVAGEAARVDLQQRAEIAPAAHDLDGVTPSGVAIPLRVSDHDPTATVHRGPNHVVMGPHQLEPELDQQSGRPSQPDVRPPHDPPQRGGVGRPDLLAQAEDRESVLPRHSRRQAVEGPPLEIELPADRRVGARRGTRRCGVATRVRTPSA
jgi:hypothetical protein